MQEPLEQFRQRVEGTGLDAAHYPYSLHKARVRGYKAIFCGLGAFLTLLSLIVFFRNTNAVSEILMVYTWLIKSLVGSFAGLLGMLSLSLGLRLQTESEVALSYWVDARRKMARIYRCKLHAEGGTWIHLIIPVPSRAQSLRLRYLQSKEQLYELQERNKVLLRQIAKAPFLTTKVREDLFNKALSELQMQMDHVVRSFSLEDRTAPSDVPVAKLSWPS